MINITIHRVNNLFTDSKKTQIIINYLEILLIIPGQFEESHYPKYYAFLVIFIDIQFKMLNK